jgi:hypothetical protein
MRKSGREILQHLLRQATQRQTSVKNLQVVSGSGLNVIPAIGVLACFNPQWPILNFAAA